MARSDILLTVVALATGCIGDGEAPPAHPPTDALGRYDNDAQIERADATPSSPVACEHTLTATSGGEAGDARAEDVEGARSLFERGSAAYEEGRHADAAEAFCRSYALSPRAPLLWNIAMSLERIELPSRAADFYDAFAERSEASSMADEARERARALR